MKHALTLVGCTLLAIFEAANADSVGICTRLAYADGGLYCRDNGNGACLADLGDFPVKRSFPWHVVWGDDMIMYLAERTGDNAGVREYTKYKDQTYMDVSPGAFAPLGFTHDNSTLADGETSWAFTAILGFIMWTPTGNLTDGKPKGGGGIVGQGFDLIDVPEYPGLKQAYWNQTLFDYMREGNAGKDLTMCNGDLRGKIIEGDRP